MNVKLSKSPIGYLVSWYNKETLKGGSELLQTWKEVVQLLKSKGIE